jgi:hypothetical protein
MSAARMKSIRFGAGGGRGRKRPVCLCAGVVVECGIDGLGRARQVIV